MPKIKITRGSNNVFADLGFPDPEMHMLKAKLVTRIQEVIRAQKLSQIQTAELIGVSQPQVSRMLRGRFCNIAVERLMLFLTRLGCAVEIVVKPENKRAFAPIHLEAEEA